MILLFVLKFLLSDLNPAEVSDSFIGLYLQKMEASVHVPYNRFWTGRVQHFLETLVHFALNCSQIHWKERFEPKLQSWGNFKGDFVHIQSVPQVFADLQYLIPDRFKLFYFL